MTGRKWWYYQEGIFLISMLAVLAMVILWSFGLYKQGIARVSHNNGPSCDMSFIVITLVWLLILYMLLFCGWQVGLVRRRLAGKPVTAWGVVVFIGSLVPFFYLGYRMLST